MTDSLEGKTALVTGASRGLGRQMAQDLAALGAIVALNYASNDEAARKTLASIEAKGGKAFLAKSALGDLKSAETLLATVDAELLSRTGSTGLDILINNAGGGPLAHLDDTTNEIYNKIVADNMSGPFFVTKVFKPRMRDNGRIILMSSVGKRKALQQYVVYAMAKAGIEIFTVAMAKEFGARGITVNCIVPGMIASDSNADIRADPVHIQFFADSTALARIGEPTDISGTALSLISPQMGFVTGQIIEVSGGLFI
jgi:NAD(P)-dependent dehydrogenase (short-subunit alcohol dehydrogenase family)